MLPPTVASYRNCTSYFFIFSIILFLYSAKHFLLDIIIFFSLSINCIMILKFSSVPLPPIHSIHMSTHGLLQMISISFVTVNPSNDISLFLLRFCTYTKCTFKCIPYSSSNRVSFSRIICNTFPPTVPSPKIAIPISFTILYPPSCNKHLLLTAFLYDIIILLLRKIIYFYVFYHYF